MVKYKTEQDNEIEEPPFIAAKGECSCGDKLDIEGHENNIRSNVNSWDRRHRGEREGKVVNEKTGLYERGVVVHESSHSFFDESGTEIE